MTRTWSTFKLDKPKTRKFYPSLSLRLHAFHAILREDGEGKCVNALVTIILVQ